MTLRSLVILVSAVSIVGAARAEASCNQPELQGQAQERATIRKLESAWVHAFLTGDSDLEGCILSPDFTEIRSDGTIDHFAEQMARVAKHKGGTDNGNRPDLQVLMHDDVAVAYAVSKETMMIDGKPHGFASADYYVWKDGAWHCFFAQQTTFPKK
jgi:hypothetical protein